MDLSFYPLFLSLTTGLSILLCSIEKFKIFFTQQISHFVQLIEEKLIIKYAVKINHLYLEFLKYVEIMLWTSFIIIWTSLIILLALHNIMNLIYNRLNMHNNIWTFLIIYWTCIIILWTSFIILWTLFIILWTFLKWL